MSYVTKVQNIYDARVTEPRLPAPIHRAADLRTDILLRERSGQKGRLLEASLAFLVKVLSSPVGDQGGWEGGARGF
jgi:hypothetical protein